ncbi:MAG: hypothetical protein R2712_25370 [Vicinamibacterales bacterium]
MATLDRDDALDLPFFDGFPYWLTRLAPAMYHVTLLPAVPGPLLERATTLQARVNGLPICLVLAEHRALYVDANNHARLSDQPPRGGFLCTGRLAAGLRGDPDSADLRARTARLSALLDAQPTQGAFFGDLTKGGRPATPDELRSLRGFQPDGTPRGLHRCSRCGDWAGTCLDPSEVFAGLVMTVHCRCDNHNRCARCGGLLAERRLNANFYDPRDRGVWHVPGFEAFGHRCAG